MRKIVFILIVVAFAVACRQPPRTEQAAPASTAKWSMALTTVPDPPLNDKPTVFRVTVLDESGKPVVGAQVKAALDMLTMDMGKNEVTFTDKGGGNYEGSGKFTMAGPWNVVVTATQAGKTARQTFSLAVKL